MSFDWNIRERGAIAGLLQLDVITKPEARELFQLQRASSLPGQLTAAQKKLLGKVDQVAAVPELGRTVTIDAMKVTDFPTDVSTNRFLDLPYVIEDTFGVGDLATYELALKIQKEISDSDGDPATICHRDLAIAKNSPKLSADEKALLADSTAIKMPGSVVERVLFDARPLLRPVYGAPEDAGHELRRIEQRYARESPVSVIFVTAATPLGNGSTYAVSQFVELDVPAGYTVRSIRTQGGPIRGHRAHKAGRNYLHNAKQLEVQTYALEVFHRGVRVDAFSVEVPESKSIEREFT